MISNAARAFGQEGHVAEPAFSAKTACVRSGKVASSPDIVDGVNAATVENSRVSIIVADPIIVLFTLIFQTSF